MGWLDDTRKHFAGRPLRLTLLAGSMLLGAAAGVPVEEAAYTYTWADPEFCNDCHVHDYANEAYERSVHAGLTTCHDCHLVPIRHYPRNLFVTLFTPPEGPDDIHAPEVEAVLCEQCHVEGAEAHLTGPMGDELRARVAKVGDSQQHRLHMDAETEDGEAITCQDCHGGGRSNGTHAFAANEENCVQCHDEHREGLHALGPIQCRSCHHAGFVASSD